MPWRLLTEPSKHRSGHVSRNRIRVTPSRRTLVRLGKGMAGAVTSCTHPEPLRLAQIHNCFRATLLAAKARERAWVGAAWSALPLVPTHRRLRCDLLFSVRATN